MPEVADFVDHEYKGGIKAFNRLSSRRQNQLLYGRFNAVTDDDKQRLKMQKSRYFKEQIITKPKHYNRKNNTNHTKPQVSTAPLTPADDPNPPGGGGTLNKAVLPPTVQVLLDMGLH